MDEPLHANLIPARAVSSLLPAAPTATAATTTVIQSGPSAAMGTSLGTPVLRIGGSAGEMLRTVGTPIPSPSLNPQAAAMFATRPHSRSHRRRGSRSWGSRDVTGGTASGILGAGATKDMTSDGGESEGVELEEERVSAGAGSDSSYDSASSGSEDELVEDVREMQEGTANLALPLDVEPITRKKRFAIVFCEDDKDWVDELPRIWVRLLRQPGEEWTLFRTAEKGELPTVDDDFDGVLIPGSSHSAYEDLPWIHRLKDYIRACYIPYMSNHNAPEHRLKPQIVGSCFGCQVIAQALGGIVTKNPRGKYVVKAEEITIQESFSRQPFAEGLILKTAKGPRLQPRVDKWRSKDTRESVSYLRVTETHGDSVLTLPADSQVLGSSKTITNEIFMTGKNLLAYQSHPEFTWKKHLLKKLMPYVFPGGMDPADLEEAKRSFELPLHSHALIEVTRRFLKREYRDTYGMYHSGSGAIAGPVAGSAVGEVMN